MLFIFGVLLFQTSDVFPQKPKEIKQEIIIPTTQEITIPLFIPPLKNYRISSGLGDRKLFDETKLHEGYDLIAPKGAIVYSVADGEVIISYPAPGVPVYGKPGVIYGGHPIYGGLLVIKHEYGMYSVYAHLSQVWICGKTKVKQGAAIGVVGNTGESYGEHLHFEIIFDPGVFLKIEPYYKGEEKVYSPPEYTFFRK